MAPIHAVDSGTNSCSSSSSNASRRACTAPLLAATPPMKATGGSTTLPLAMRALEVADHRVAQTAQHLGRLVALLLGVDHVALGEDAAAPGDAGRLAGVEHDVADVLDVVVQAARLLVHERPGAGGAVAVGLVVGDADPAQRRVGLQADVLGGLAAHLEDGVRPPGAAAPRPRAMALNSFSKPALERLADQAAAGAGDAHAARPRPRQDHGQQFVDQRPGRPRAGLPLMRRYCDTSTGRPSASVSPSAGA